MLSAAVKLEFERKRIVGWLSARFLPSGGGAWEEILALCRTDSYRNSLSDKKEVRRKRNWD